MASVEKEAISDFSEIFQEYYDRLPRELKELLIAFKDLNKWLIRPTTEEQKEKYGDNAVYQYLPETQSDFLDHQSRISAITESVFLVVKDINDISAVGTSTYEKTQNVASQNEGQGEKQVINVNTGTPSAFGRLFRKPPQTNLPKTIEDFWVRSENWKEEIMNIPNVWAKYIDWHHMGVLRHKVFDGDGMDDYLNNEITYLNTRIEPNIAKVVKRAIELKLEKVVAGLSDIYVNTLQTEKETELAKIAMGGGGQQPEQK